MKKILILCCFLLLLSLTASCFEIKNNNDLEIIEETSQLFEFSSNYCGTAQDPGYIAVNTVSPNEEYTYDVFCDYGYVGTEFDEMNKTELNDICNSTNNDIFWIGWRPSLERETEDYYFKVAYITLIQKENDKIIGYSIIEAVQGQYAYGIYTGEIICSKTFPKINNKYQIVEKEYINNKLDEIKNIEIIQEDIQKPSFKYNTCSAYDMDSFIGINVNDPDKKYLYDADCYHGYVSIETMDYFNIAISNVSNYTENDEFWIGWRPIQFDGDSLPEFDKDYITIKKKENKCIIEIILLEISLVDKDNLIYKSEIVKCISFPKLNGEYQYVRLVHIIDIVNKIIDERKLKWKRLN